jgi:mRNA-degrading endonuclease toxin of MazEF toxin-antitoxin module
VKRGDVHLVQLELPDRTKGSGTSPRAKYVVILQSGAGFDNLPDVAVVVCSSSRKAGRPIRPFEVLVGPDEGFETETVIDCRWVRTIQKQDVPQTRYTELSDVVMDQISAALAVGLQL